MVTPTRPLSGRVAAVTGGARGIGRAVAAALAREGVLVAIGDLDGDATRRAAEGLSARAARGGRVVGFPLDVTSRASYAAFLAAADAELGPLDVLVGNAGVMHLGPLVDEDDAVTRRMVDVNVHGVLLGMKLVLPDFLARGTGHLVAVASTVGTVGLPGGATYCGTKHFVLGAAEAVRAEVRGSGVEVSSVLPGVVDTRLAAGVNSAAGIAAVPPEAVADAVVGLLRRPRAEVFVPASMGRVSRLGRMLPRRARESLMRMSGADRALVPSDPGVRLAYEAEMAGAEPVTSIAGTDEFRSEGER
jgi:NADP-dependent 3-hydroxy acid dehydrogenase YdfG